MSERHGGHIVHTMSVIDCADDKADITIEVDRTLVKGKNLADMNTPLGLGDLARWLMGQA